MRMKRKPWADELYEQNQNFYKKFPYDIKGNWHNFFGNDKPIELEIGSGKGGFITQLAKIHPEKNFIALEINEMALAYLLRKQFELKLPNLFLIIGDAKEVDQYFEKQEINNIYLNFSDPWPKSRHEKRRLTSPGFLDRYQKILNKNGKLTFKTDNQSLFIYSIKTIANKSEAIIDKLTFDLHNSEFVKENVETEYEIKFSKKGAPIYMLEAHFKKGDKDE
ncbi:tRNA (guanosine(46)-N7)-methyltransferase TrmB [Xylocopilactobacillus apis]|uniref:tRNA (guanine-N(7)-)-methyltransferase n=1 Tax=Xylocopilactobacillus apis TaxID=2932183 RepID=A0AAU9D9T2_9LACO|nr:tRNA (guanosine(46)-N7)-methyltransferase TrmB [Xylocopilactobacillus apis]BDR56400.1 tRNA (guanine-N(7)-)-methyltransferase [Xylocopilactobacillus apis]